MIFLHGKKMLVGAVLLLGGCTTFESSTYENRSTKEGTVVTATGRAAEVAAGANTSHNCPTCAPTTSTSASTTSSATQTQVDTAGERITNSAINRVSYRIEQAINDGIDDLFD